MPSPTIAEQVAAAPAAPGCYLWIGLKPGENIPGTLYVGKAINLKRRLHNYLNSDDYKTGFLMSKVTSVEWVVTDNEAEALLLENTLIKKHTPPYNIRLKDGKSYPYLCLTLGEPFPRLILTRKKFSSGHLYFGPFTDVKAARNSMSLIHKVFPIRKRALKLPLKFPGKPCLNFHINRCWGPCTGNVDVEHYNLMILQIKDFLEGKSVVVRKAVSDKMEHYAGLREYEKAAQFRDILHSIDSLESSQNVESVDDLENFDIIGIFCADKMQLESELNIPPEFLEYFSGMNQGVAGQIVLLKIRNSKLISKESHALSESFELVDSDKTERFFLEGFFRDYYLRLNDIPEEIIISEMPGLKETWEKILSDKIRHPTTILTPTEKQKREVTGNFNLEALMLMALNNAKLTLRERILSEKIRNQRIGLRQIQKFLNLPKLPAVIECYDISNIQGHDSVAAGVMLKDGIPHKSGYRKYKIKTFDQANDPGMINEVLSRRFNKIANSEIKLPDLIVIDGGLTQLRAALSARNDKGLKVAMIGLAKQREEIYTEDGDVLQFDKNSPGMILLRLARDEAHRFGVSYHRNLRMKRNAASTLDSVDGISTERKKVLMNFLRKIDLDSFTNISLSEKLAVLPAIGEELAHRVSEKLLKRDIV